MSRRFSNILVLTAWLLATGSQWDVAQVAVWGRMLADNSRSMTLIAAIEKTFSGERCPSCSALAAAREGTDGGSTPVAPTAIAAGKVEILQLATALVLSTPAVLDLGVVPSTTAYEGPARSAPPLGPPRA